MDNPRAEKVAVVDEVRQRLTEADASILTEYRGLKVKDLAQLRRNLTPTGAEYKIYKNTLVRFAAQDLGLEALHGMIEGPTAIAFVKGDAAAAARTLRDFSRTNPTLVVKGGVLGQKVLDARETAALAELPSREVLLARFAGGLAAPLQQLAGLLAALPRNLAYGLKALVDQRSSEQPTESSSIADSSSEQPTESSSIADSSSEQPTESSSEQSPPEVQP